MLSRSTKVSIFPKTAGLTSSSQLVDTTAQITPSLNDSTSANETVEMIVVKPHLNEFDEKPSDS